MHKFTISFLALLLFADTAFAQRVQLNRDVLEGYTPPVMFGGAPLTAPDVMTPMPKKAEITPPFKNPPVPLKKPVYKKPVTKIIAKNQPNGAKAAPVEPVAVEKIVTSSPPQDLEVKTPDVRDILASIDPDAVLPPEREEVKEPAKQRVFAQPLPSTPNVISLQFMPDEENLNAGLSPGLVEKIFAKTKAKSGARIELRAFAASASESNESKERRIALARALDVRDLLTQNRISASIIDVMPLGRHTETTPVDRVDIVFTGQ